MCYFNRLTRVARWLADYPEWLRFCWDFIKPHRNDEIALQHFFSCLQQYKNFFSSSFVLHASFCSSSACRNFFSKSPTPPAPQELNGRPLRDFYAKTLKSSNSFLLHRILMYKTLRTLFLFQASANHISIIVYKLTEILSTL